MNLLFKLLILMPLLISESNADTSLSSSIKREYGYLKNIYHSLHRYPELSFQESKTAALISKEMRLIGFEVNENIGGFGVVSILRNGDGPTVMIRSDMDALPVEEKTGLAYASTQRVFDDGGKEVHVMHACGHDIHMTVSLGVARILASNKQKWHGTIVMVSQPAEERAAGARKMLQDGLFTKFPRPDYNLALHVSAEHEAGQVAYISGYAMASVDMVDVTLFGVGGHGAYPHTAKDPVVLAAQFINALQTLVSREIAPTEPGVVTVGSIHGGSKHNIIADKVLLELTVRSFSEETRAKLLDGIGRIAKAQAESIGMPKEKLPVVSIRDEHTAAVYNHPQLTQRAQAALRNQLGHDRIIETSPVMGGEDFSEYGRVEPNIPSMLLWLGSVDPIKLDRAKLAGNVVPSLHSPFFSPLPKPTITTGVEAIMAVVLELMGAPKNDNDETR